MIARSLQFLLRSLLLLLLVLATILWLLLGTSTGNQWLFEQARQWIPGELTLEHWEGNLLDSVALEGLHYRNGTLNIQLDQGRVALIPRSLTQGWLDLEYLRLGSLLISTEASEPSDTAPSITLPDSLSLPFGVRIETLDAKEIRLNNTRIVGDVHGRRLVAWRRFQIAHLNTTTVADTRLTVSGQGSLTGPITVDANVDWTLPLPPSETLTAQQASGQLQVKGPIDTLQINHQLQHPVTVKSEGTIEWQQDQPRLALLHQWPAQPLPLNQTPVLTLTEGTLYTRGLLDTLQLDAKTGLIRDKLAVAINMTGSRIDDGLSLENLTLTQGKQTLQANGQLLYGPLRWDVNLQGNLNPEILSPELPGQLTINGNSKGRYDNNEWVLSPSHLKVNGQLRRQPLSVQAELYSQRQRLALTAAARFGDNQAHLKGNLLPDWQIDSTLKLQRLNQIHPDLDGDLSGQIALRGELNSPRASGQLNGQQTGWQQWSLGTLTARFQDLGLGSQPQQLTLNANQIQQDHQQRLETLDLTLAGTRQQHQLTVSATQQSLTLETHLNGALDTTLRWQGDVTQSRIVHEALGQWQQQQTSALTLSAENQSLAPFCLRQDDSALCVQGTYQADNHIQVQGSVQSLPLSLLSPLTGPDFTLEGRLEATVAIEGSIDNPQGELHAQTQGASISVNAQDAPPPLDIHTLSVHSQLKNRQLDSQLQLASSLGEARATLRHGLQADSPVQGNVNLMLHSLGIIELFTADLRDIEGTLRADVELAGSLRAPHIDGQIQLLNGQALVPALGTAISDVTLVLSGSPDGDIAVNGQAIMGDGKATLSGSIQPHPWPLSLSLTVSGQNLLVANRPDARVLLSPDLQLQGNLEALALTGSLIIPEADIRPVELPENAITVSRDQVLVHQQGEDNGSLPLSLNVTVTLGDQVYFKGFGLDATLGGTLAIEQKPQRPPQLNGELVVREGRYRAYGQNLAISDGRLIFQGAPDNPGLDIRAIRKVPSEAITVGVQLGGTLQEPEASLFSDPGMEQSQVMSYLLTGRPLESGSNSDANRIAQALALYGLEKGSGVTEKIGDKIGVDDISVGSDWETDDASLMLGKQLSDRLYLTYAIGLFDAVSTVMLRYTLTRSLHLEARSSTEANSLDIIWEKELR